MKNRFLVFRNSLSILVIVMMPFIAGCGHEEAKADETKVLYKAIAKDDTASLHIHIDEKEFYGQYEINYHGSFKDSGDVSGIIHGDTLKGTYHYQHYGIEQWRRIPISLLRKDEKLIMGVGAMEIYMNMTFFKKGEPLDYAHPKFVFSRDR